MDPACRSDARPFRCTVIQGPLPQPGRVRSFRDAALAESRSPCFQHADSYRGGHRGLLRGRPVYRSRRANTKDKRPNEAWFRSDTTRIRKLMLKLCDDQTML